MASFSVDSLDVVRGKTEPSKHTMYTSMGPCSPSIGNLRSNLGPENWEKVVRGTFGKKIWFDICPFADPTVPLDRIYNSDMEFDV